MRSNTAIATTTRYGIVTWILLGLQASAATLEVRITDQAGKPVENAVVFALPLTGTAPNGKLTAIIDQIDKEFVPRVSVIQTGTAVTFPNKDNIRHQVYSFSPAKTFTSRLYAGTPAKPEIFDKPGLVTLGCNIHDWMLAYVYVVDTPWFGKTDSKGSARIDELPNGDYLLKSWHPQLLGEVLSQTIKVSSEVSGPFNFKLNLGAKPATLPRGESY